MNGGLQPLPTDCRCYRCSTGYVGRIVVGVLVFVMWCSFVAWVLG